MSGQDNSNIFDTEIIDSLVETLGNSVSRIISIYIEDFPRNVQIMREALEQNNYEIIGRTAHSLKSSSGNLGAKQIVELSIALEQKINNDPQEPEIADSITKLEVAFKEIRPLLSDYMR